MKFKFYHLFRVISDDIWLKVPKIAKKGTLVEGLDGGGGFWYAPFIKNLALYSSH